MDISPERQTHTLSGLPNMPFWMGRLELSLSVSRTFRHRSARPPASAPRCFSCSFSFQYMETLKITQAKQSLGCSLVPVFLLLPTLNL